MATGRWEILHMHRIFRKDQVLTIPNLLSVIRLALIPLIVWLYIGKQEYSAAVAVILISGATDIIDGFIARKFNMVSDLGKILDPVADKLTQATVILCLTVKYRWMRGLIVSLWSRRSLWPCSGIWQFKRTMLLTAQNGMASSTPWFCIWL